MRFRLEAVPDKLKPGLEKDMDQMEAMLSSVFSEFGKPAARSGINGA
jgi:hypothetical protein